MFYSVSCSNALCVEYEAKSILRMCEVKSTLSDLFHVVVWM